MGAGCSAAARIRARGATYLDARKRPALWYQADPGDADLVTRKCRLVAFAGPEDLVQEL